MSYETPEYTANADVLGRLRLLEAIYPLGLKESSASIRPRHPIATVRNRKSRKVRQRPSIQRSPYAAAKLHA